MNSLVARYSRRALEDNDHSLEETAELMMNLEAGPSLKFAMPPVAHVSPLSLSRRPNLSPKSPDTDPASPASSLAVRLAARCHR